MEVDGDVAMTLAEKFDLDDNAVPNDQFLQSYDPLLRRRTHHNRRDKENIRQVRHVLVPFQV